MTNNKQQTAVEWFANESWQLKVQLENEEISVGEYAVSYVRLLYKAKEMHKEEITQAWKKGDGQFDKVSDKMSLEYYEQTYGGGEQ